MVPIPALNATLNAASAILLTAGYIFIRRRRVPAHHWSMIGAFVLSCFFLAGYLWFDFHHGLVRYRGTGWLRTTYFSILIPHIILAAAVPPLAIITLVFAFRGNFARHRGIARWTLPIWLFVSVTGVIVYFMLFR